MVESQSNRSLCRGPVTSTIGSQTLQRATGYHDLPQHVLVNIFSYFSEKDISIKLCQVCRNWRQATQHPSLWKHLEFNGTNVAVSTICNKLRTSPKLETVKFICVPDIITVIRQLCRCNENVKNVSLRSCSNPEEDAVMPQAVITNLIKSCLHLEVLDLKGLHFHTHQFVQDLLKVPKLKSLNLGHNRYLRARDLVTVSINCRSLEELKVSRLQTDITDSAACFMFDNLQETLTSLTFDARNLGPATFKAILNCSKLRVLRLNNVLLMPSDIFRSLAACLPNIKILKISNGSQISSDDFQDLFGRNVNVMGKISSLDFSGCWKLGDDGLKTIVDTCGTNLEHLVLRGCKSLTNDGLEYAFKQCCVLKRLDVAHVVNLHPPTLSQIQTNIPSLKILIVDGDARKEETLRRLMSNLPCLQISRSISEFCKQEVQFQ